jgi:hypothetical protein
MKAALKHYKSLLQDTAPEGEEEEEDDEEDDESDMM